MVTRRKQTACARDYFRTSAPLHEFLVSIMIYLLYLGMCQQSLGGSVRICAEQY